MYLTTDNDTNTGSSANSFMIGMLCGVAVGAAVGLLLAPKPGVDIRRDLAKGAKDLKRRAEDLYRSAAGTVEDITAQAMDEGRDAAETLSGKVRSHSQAN